MEDHQVLRLIAGFLPVHLHYSGMMFQSHQLVQKIAGLTSINIFKQVFVIYHFAKACQERGFIPADNISATAQILSFPQQYQNQLLPAFLYLNH